MRVIPSIGKTTGPVGTVLQETLATSVWVTDAAVMRAVSVVYSPAVLALMEGRAIDLTTMLSR